MTTLSNYRIERANEAITAITNGGRFNGTVYAKAGKKGYFVSVYVSNQEYCFGQVDKQDVEAVKKEFLAAVSQQNTKTSGKDERYIFGTDAWLHSGMNAE